MANSRAPYDVAAEGLELRDGYDGFCDEVGAAFVVRFRVAHSDTGLPVGESVVPSVETDVAFCCGVARGSGQRVIRHDTHPAVGENPTKGRSLTLARRLAGGAFAGSSYVVPRYR